MSATGAMTTQT